MDVLADTRLLFNQLAAIPDAQAVRTVIENHDAWQHNETALAVLDRSLRSRVSMLPRDVIRDARVESQRRRLQPLVTQLPIRRAVPAA